VTWSVTRRLIGLAEELEPLLAGIVHAGEPLKHPHVRRGHLRADLIDQVAMGTATDTIGLAA